MSFCTLGEPTQAQWDEFALLGDINRDGIIDQKDRDLLAARFGWSGTPGEVPEDLNLDGVVDIKDAAICAQNSGKDICPHFNLGQRPIVTGCPFERLKQFPYLYQILCQIWQRLQTRKLSVRTAI